MATVRTIPSPTPYGTLAHLHLIDGADPSEPDSWAYTIEDAALLAGIYDPEDRARLTAAADRGEVRSANDLFRFGGRPVPRVPLPLPSSFVYETIPADHEPGMTNDHGVSMRDCADQWATLVSDREEWTGRARVLLDTMEGQRAAVAGAPDSITGFALGSMLTAALENLGEKEVECLEAAAFYMLTHHDGWRDAGRRWLSPFRDTWFRDWRDARPEYRRISALVRLVHDDVPAWAHG